MNIFNKLFESILSEDIGGSVGGGWRTGQSSYADVTATKVPKGMTLKDLLKRYDFTTHAMEGPKKAKAQLAELQSLKYPSKVVACYWVDREHSAGPEEHYITDNSIVIIVNPRKNQIITFLFARKEQIEGYLRWSNRPISNGQRNASAFYVAHKWNEEVVPSAELELALRGLPKSA